MMNQNGCRGTHASHTHLFSSGVKDALHPSLPMRCSMPLYRLDLLEQRGVVGHGVGPAGSHLPLRDAVEPAIAPGELLDCCWEMCHGAAIRQQPLHTARVQADAQLPASCRCQLLNQLADLCLVILFHLPDSRAVLGTYRHEGTDPDQLLQHRLGELHLIEHLAAQTTSVEASSHSSSMLAIGCSQALRVDIRLAVSGLVALLGHCKVDQDLSVLAQVPGIQPGLQHAILDEHQIFPAVGWGEVDHSLQVIIAGAHNDRTWRTVHTLSTLDNHIGCAHISQGETHTTSTYDRECLCLRGCRHVGSADSCCAMGSELTSPSEHLASRKHLDSLSLRA
mmetsp:Transcript_12300/g.26540  ORF Transcript_12300/g.26540 Transcript_12300/m.26540 type:complete len:336 (+) Transcript_12300:303-1310(+)